MPRESYGQKEDISLCNVNPEDSSLIQGLWAGPLDGLYDRNGVPDTKALYYRLSLPVLTEEDFGDAHFEIEGYYPEARFMSATLYNEEFVYEGHLRDEQLVASPGSFNPYLKEMYPLDPLSKRKYSIKISDFDKLNRESSTNQMMNYIVGGRVASGAKVKYHHLIIRYYEPVRSPGENPGKVPLPKVYFIPDNSSPNMPLDPCNLIKKEWYSDVSTSVSKMELSQKLVQPLINQAGQLRYPGYEPLYNPIYNRAQWIFGGRMECTMNYIFSGNFVNKLFTLLTADSAFDLSIPCEANSPSSGPEYSKGAFNFDQRYLLSFPDPSRGVAIYRFKAPVAAKRGQNMSLKNFDLRYWSICLVQAENLFYSYDCFADNEFVRDPSDPSYVTFIVSRYEDRPLWACDLLKRQKNNCQFNWMPYVSPVTWLYMRTLDPNPKFKEAPMYYNWLSYGVNNSPAIQNHMKEYYPISEYCSWRTSDSQSCSRLLIKFKSISVDFEASLERISKKEVRPLPSQLPILEKPSLQAPIINNTSFRNRK